MNRNHIIKNTTTRNIIGIVVNIITIVVFVHSFQNPILLSLGWALWLINSFVI